MEQIRSFIAIELPPELKLALGRLEDSLKANISAAAKWVEPQGIHLTLKFLGNIGSDRVQDIIGIMQQSARGIPPFQLETGNVGAFPELRRPRVFWVGIGGQLDQLHQLQQRIESNLLPLGFARETRPFSAHLTLARLRGQPSPEESQRLGQLIAATKLETSYSIGVSAISLMRSQLTPGGAIYSRLGSVTLG